MYLARIFITLKPAVNDPQGITIRSGLHTIGFKQVADVRMGKFLEVTLDTSARKKADALVRDMCDKLLANPIIENFTYELEETRTRHVSSGKAPATARKR